MSLRLFMASDWFKEMSQDDMMAEVTSFFSVIVSYNGYDKHYEITLA